METRIRTVHIQLGRNGDLIILLPVWRKIVEDTGERPVVVVAKEFAGVLRGATYVEPDIINAHWYASVIDAAEMAKLKYGHYTITQCHGVGHETDQRLYPSFGEAMWAKAGFPGQYGKLPLVFNRRNVDREERLWRSVDNGRPMLLFNFSGRSSPLPCQREVHNRIRKFSKDFNLVNLNGIKADYIYDLLGLYDNAAGLITIDTATLHLAAASKIPMLAYCRGGWSSAIPKPDAIKVEYPQAHLRLDVVDEFLLSLKSKHAQAS